MTKSEHLAGCAARKRCRCTWRFRTDEPEGSNGKRRQVSLGGYESESKAREALLDVQMRIASGQVVSKSPTVAAYLAGWLDSKELVKKPSTVASYRDLSKRFLIPHLGHHKLTDLRAQHVEEMLTAMTAAMAADKGVRTRRLTVAVLSSALGSAVKRRLIPWNVCTQVELPANRRKSRTAWDASQVAGFLEHVEDDRLAALWRLYLFRGLRRGEALALRWRNIDLTAGTIRLDETLGEVAGRLQWGTVKTADSARTIHLDQDTIRALRAHLEMRNSYLEVLDVAREGGDGLVFCQDNGLPLWPGAVSKRFKTLASEVDGLPSISLHDTRHTAATLALNGGVDLKTVSSNLGHSGIAITADIYGHTLPATAVAGAETVAAMVRDASRKASKERRRKSVVTK